LGHRRNNSGSLAIFTAIRRASSLVSIEGTPEPGFRHATCGVPLEAHAESAVLASVEREYGRIDSDAGERLIDYAARESGRSRVEFFVLGFR
jgi:hypothetical protein